MKNPYYFECFICNTQSHNCSNNVNINYWTNGIVLYHYLLRCIEANHLSIIYSFFMRRKKDATHLKQKLPISAFLLQTSKAGMLIGTHRVSDTARILSNIEEKTNNTCNIAFIGQVLFLLMDNIANSVALTIFLIYSELVLM